MSDPIEINGKKVYSDKALRSIHGTKIIFSDGSWCDVESGQVANSGPGYINIGSPIEKTVGNETREKSFTARALEVDSISADVDIQVTDGNKISVKAKGPASKIKDIDFVEKENTVFVKGKCESRTSGISIISSGGSINIGSSCSGRVITSGGDISIRNGQISGNSITIGSGSMSENETKITIGVPKGTSIKISKICGQTKIGNTEGSLQVNIAGGNKVNAGNVKDATINMQGSGDVDIQEINGNLTVQIAGSGDVNVKRGKAPMLNVNITGSGDARYGGKAENANLSVIGSGDINVAFVKNRPNKNTVGNGDIKVGNWK
ncbi:MAG: DUF2807 domain-containing protein [Minisyncoccia bacterium]